ncbi:hypothetical protein J6590_078967 [Homalodisca vitripennis]|nr:hypothetical protein J6590_078967 [Homalodisca vitripennis]
MQKNGAGLHTASSCYWDNTTDGSCTVRWENKTMYCIASVFIVRIKMLVCIVTVTCTIMQKNGAGLHTASSCYWDNTTDGSCTVRWENKTMYCIVSVFIVRIKMLVCIVTVTCTIMQKNGAGLHTASSCYWDNTTDGSCTVRWENKTMYCIVSVFIVRIKMLVCIVTVTCTIMQKNGAGLHTASSCYWDNTTDGSCTVRWENKTMYCIVSVFIVRIKMLVCIVTVTCTIMQKNGAGLHTASSCYWDNTTDGSCTVLTCTIMQKNGAGLHTASSCYWDNTTDGSCTVRWENKTMYCIVSVFGLSI